MDVKEKLLSTMLFEGNQYFELYIKLIQDNICTTKEKFKTQRHHILPRVAFTVCNLEYECDGRDNITNLSYQDHILAHYYLALASAENEFRYKMIASINFILFQQEDPHLLGGG